MSMAIALYCATLAPLPKLVPRNRNITMAISSTVQLVSQPQVTPEGRAVWHRSRCNPAISAEECVPLRSRSERRRQRWPMLSNTGNTATELPAQFGVIHPTATPSEHKRPSSKPRFAGRSSLPLPCALPVERAWLQVRQLAPIASSRPDRPPPRLLTAAGHRRRFPRRRRHWWCPHRHCSSCC